MGLGDVAKKVLPKFAIVAPPTNGGNIASRYFVPWNCHSAYAVTGALCLGAACCIPGTVAYEAARLHDDQVGLVVIEHPAGRLETRMTMRKSDGDGGLEFDRAGIVRTARPLLAGVVHVLVDAWSRRSDGIAVS
jgi:2-methylaconitate cis-trans-isomerase PrpF